MTQTYFNTFTTQFKKHRVFFYLFWVKELRTFNFIEEFINIIIKILLITQFFLEFKFMLDKNDM